MTTNRGWDKYEKCNQYLQENSVVECTRENWDFYLDNQWNIGYNRRLNVSGINLPFDNIIKPIIKFQTSTITQNAFVPTFNTEVSTERAQLVAGLMSRMIMRDWDLSHQKTRTWQIVKRGLIQGESYQYLGTADPKDDQVISNTNILFGDEGNPNIQEQPYIIVRERLLVSEIKRQGAENGVSEEELNKIQGDADKSFQITDTSNSDIEDKCTSILVFERKKDGYIYFSRSTKECEWQPERAMVEKTNGKVSRYAKLYPFVKFAPEDIPDVARGKSFVRPMIPNQIAINKILVRRDESNKISSFPRVIYDSNKIMNESDLDKAGAKIAVDGQVQSVKEAIDYLEPMSSSPDAAKLQEDLINRTREVNGSVDAITGATDPTRVSGSAVIAMREQSALPLNEPVDKLKQFVEDYANVWYEQKMLYNPKGFEFEGQKITPKELDELNITIRIDVSQDTPWTKNAEQGFLDNIYSTKDITLEEYVDLAPENGVVPKGKMQKMFAIRAQKAKEAEEAAIAQQQEQEAMMMQGVPNATQMPMQPQV